MSSNFIEALLFSENVHQINPYYFWNIMDSDPDDNKFVDCAVVANADFIVTNAII